MKITVTVKKIRNVTGSSKSTEKNKTMRFNEVWLYRRSRIGDILQYKSIISQLLQIHKLQYKWLAFVSPSVSRMFFTTVSMETSLSRHASNADVQSVKVARARQLTFNLHALLAGKTRFL